jgi:hypothetical protein
MSTVAPKLHYRTATLATSVKLTLDAQRDLAAIQRILQRESEQPNVPVSQSTAVRRALEVYAASLSHLTGRLRTESGRATASTYRKDK